MRVFQSGKSDRWADSVMYVQTTIKSRTGLGVPIFVEFYAPLDLKRLDDEIKYDWRGLGDDIDLIQNDERKYCIKQCYKMAYYIQKMH